ncbi:HNH endonuclease [Candidatus Micrarchaeota archaeon]|nr:HNH endonuclease [Candidatus Micrarchaeota archaeon]
MARFLKLVVSYAPSDTWRDYSQKDAAGKREWNVLREKILRRDGFACRYCGYASPKYQVVHHVNGNHANNSEANLVTICQMCNLIAHAGQGCVIKGIVDLYRKSKYGQNEITRITREKRDEGKTDDEIICFLGLECRVPFKMDRLYLYSLFGFVTSRKCPDRSDMYERWKAYHALRVHRAAADDGIQSKLAEF